MDQGQTKIGLAALAVMRKRIGIVERPSGSNRGPEIDRWNTQAGVALGSPYCASSIHSAFLEAGYDLGGRFANADSYCPSLYSWGKGLGFDRKRPFKGYVVLFDWDEDGVLDHVGIVDTVLALSFDTAGNFTGLITTVESNTSPGVSGSQSNGDGTWPRKRQVNAHTRFLRIPDGAE